MRRSLVSCCLCGAFAAALLLSLPARAQTSSCDDNARKQFNLDVAGGSTDATLEAKYGHCRFAYTEPPLCATDNSKIIAFIPSNVFYERMNGCGYNPQTEVVGCDVEIRRLTGYGPFGAAPAGSLERIRVCLDCNRDGVWDFQAVGNVHVTDNIAAGPIPSWYHLASVPTAGAPAACTANNGGQTDVRVILSWSAIPPVCVNAALVQPMPVWGNLINFTARRDP